MGWVYKYIDSGVNDNGTRKHWGVGYYIKDHFEIISYFALESEAIARVSLLNGGQ